MSSTVKVINARSLLDSFTDTEFNQLLVKVSRQCGRAALLTPFFNQFITIKSHSSNKAHITPQIDTMMNIINTIIRSRKQSDVTSSLKPNINTIPKSLIGEVSSYLAQNDHISLSKANRTIHIGCNDPNTLKHLNLLKCKNYSCIELQKYPQLTHLQMDITRLNQLSLPTNKTISNYLHKLTLDGNEQDDIDLNPLISQTAIDLNNVTHLQLQRFGTHIGGRLFSKDKLIRLLSNFPNVEYLRCARILLLGLNNQFNLKSVIPHLKGISNGERAQCFQNHILSEYGPSLEIMRIQDDGIVDIPSNVSFPKLEIISVNKPTTTTMNKILATTNSLKIIDLRRITSMITNKSHIKEMLTKLITTNKSLEMLIVHDTKHDTFDCICDGIEKGLYLSKEKQGNLKIYVSVGYDKALTTPKSSDTFVKISRIMNQISSTKLDNFMLAVAISGNIDDEWEGHSNLFMEQNKAKFKTELECKRWQLIITNFNCDLDYGWRGEDSFMFDLKS